MVKYGKKYREFQIEEWKPHYINYKALKQKIKQIKRKLPKEEDPSNTLFGVSNINPIPLVPENIDSMEDQNLAPLFCSKYGKYLKEFIDLLNEQFHKFYVFFSNTEKQLYQEINTHLYAKEDYHKFNKKQIKREINSLGVSIYLAKCLNCFINDNLTAVKKILKKFDKNFVDYYGLIAPRYILSQISSTSNDLDYVIQFKIIDEASCVCEENANILKDLYYKANDNSNNNIIGDNNSNQNNNRNGPEVQVDFMQQYKELLMCIREIDEVIDFKIQYKEWFSFIKRGNKLIKNNPTLLENDIFNPLISSTNYKDSLIEKFLSTNKAFYEIEDVQISVSDLNRRNMNLILIHKLFYNSLITCLIPTLYFFIKNNNQDDKPALSFLYVIIILSLTYIASFISLYFLKKAGTKITLSISYGFFFIGSLFHIISCNSYFNRVHNLPRLLYLIISRLFIGIGSMELVGRKYIALYSPKFYLIKISKNYTKINYIGYALGPLIACILLFIPINTNYKGYIHYNEFNCIGWYGMIMSFILLFFHSILFTKENSDDFQMIRDEHNLKFAIKTSFHSDSQREKIKASNLRKRRSKSSIYDEIITKENLIEGLIPDEIDSDNDKKIEKIEKKEKKVGKGEKPKKRVKFKEQEVILNVNENKNKKDNKNIIVKENKEEKNEEKFDEEKEEEKDKVLNMSQVEEETRKYSIANLKKNISSNNNEEDLNEKISKSSTSLIRINLGRPSDLSICSNNLDTGLNSSQILSTKQKNMINTIESKLDEYNTKSNFTNINMIPKTIDLLIAKEKKTFGYLKKNILISFLILFFSNVIKENIIISFSYHLYEEEMTKDFELCLYLCGIYIIQLISLAFILPLKKINILMKKYIIIFMLSTVIFISPLLYKPISNSKILYILIAYGVILLCSILTILASCYLSYLLPPGWTICCFRAGKLPLFLIIFGKIVGIFINILNSKKNNLNINTIFGVTILSYGIIIVYLLNNQNFRIKVIARIMRKRVFENIGI